MASWQKRLRLGVAIFGLVFAGIVYSAIGERQTVAPPAPLQRRDPKATLETIAAVLQRVTGTEQQFQITADRTQHYDDGSTKQFGVKIIVRNKEGRDFTVSAREAQAGKDQTDRQLDGDVKLMASDGFELTTDHATHHANEGVARAPGVVAFRKGRMSGSGVGMTYDQNRDVLAITQHATITIKDDAGNTTVEFTAGTATLDRLQNQLTLDGAVHVLRGEQVIDGDHAVAHMSEREEFITFVQLQGNARVVGGGGGIDSMSARDIDLDYTDDGKLLERAALKGGSALVMSGQNGAAGRQILGDTLDLQLAADGAVTSAVGRGNVRLDLPASEAASARSIRARTLDAHGQPGQGLTSATFTDDVVYTEEARRGVAARVVRARALMAALASDAVTSATFTGTVTFEEQALAAGAARLEYQPDKGTLVLTGSDGGGGPRVEDEQITINAQKIDVALEGRRMTAQGAVKTTLRPRPTGAAAAQRAAGDAGPTRLPGLLKQDQAANVTASTLDYQGAAGKALYSGDARLWQGQTSIRAKAISIDQQSGDLEAIGAARSELALDSGGSSGVADEIRYDDAKRVITYSIAPAPVVPTRGGGRAPAPGAVDAPTRDNAASLTPGSAVAPTPGSPIAPTPGSPVAPTSGSGIAPRGSVAVPARESHLIGPQGSLRAQKIEIVLAPEGSRAERIEAYTDVTMKVDARTATGARLTYHAQDERYVMSSAAAVPVRVVEAPRTPGATCNETTGNTLTFYKSSDRIIVDGANRNRTQTTGSACLPAPAR